MSENWIILFLVILGISQVVALLRIKPSKRKYLKFFLNFLLFMAVYLLVLPPTWNLNTDKVKIGIATSDLPSDFISTSKKNQNLEKIYYANDYQKDEYKNFENIFLLGQNFSVDFLSQLYGKNVIHLPYFFENQIKDLHWLGLLRQHEAQVISGQINVNKKVFLHLKLGNTILDSVEVSPKKTSFKLKTNIIQLGKSNLSIYLGNQLLKDIHFYVLPPYKFKVQILADFPDFETKVLAEWLGKNGHSVQVKTLIAKDIINTTQINEKSNSDFDYLIISPSQINRTELKNAINKNKSVMVFNFSDPVSEIENINKVFKTNFSIKRISQEDDIKISSELSIFPYKIEDNRELINSIDYPLAAHYKKIGISLLKETYPLTLSGDSTTYQKIWTAWLSLQSSIKINNILIDAPIISNVFEQISFNNFEDTSSFDSISLKSNPVNSSTKNSNIIFEKSGWQILNDSISLFVEDSNSTFTKQRHLINFLKNNELKTGNHINPKEETLPSWLRFLIFILVFFIVWAETKI
jgi:hypothetical protein